MQKVLAQNPFFNYTFPVNKTYEIFIQYADRNERGFAFEVKAKGIRLSIEAACKEMKEAYPCFVEGVDFFIVEIKQK